MSELVILEGEQLRQLARIIRNQEAEAIHNIRFQSEHQLAQYLRDSAGNYQSVIKLLDDSDGMKHTFEGDETRSLIAHNIHSYLVLSVNVALQAVKNYTLRMNYLTKINEHWKDILKALETFDKNNVRNVGRLAKEAVQYRNCMLEYTRKYQSPASRNFSKCLKESGIEFKDLITRYKNRRGFSGPFKELANEEKLLVFNDIIDASGRGRMSVNKLSKASGAAGIAVLILIAGMMVWDIFSSEHIFQTAAHDVVVTVASMGGAMLGEVVGASLPYLVGVEASPLFVMANAIIGSILGAFVIGSFVGWVIDYIFYSGGSTPPLSTSAHRCYVAPLPDGEALAREIARRHSLTN